MGTGIDLWWILEAFETQLIQITGLEDKSERARRISKFYISYAVFVAVWDSGNWKWWFELHEIGMRLRFGFCREEEGRRMMIFLYTDDLTMFQLVWNLVWFCTKFVELRRGENHAIKAITLVTQNLKKFSLDKIFFALAKVYSPNWNFRAHSHIRTTTC
jgi:hypothetical protein